MQIVKIQQNSFSGGSAYCKA